MGTMPAGTIFVTDHTTDIARLNAFVEMLQRSMEYQTGTLVSMSSEIGRIREENLELRERTTLQRSHITTLQEKGTVLEAQIRKLNDEKAYYIQQAQIWQAKYEFLERENNALRQEIHSLKENSPRL